MNTHTKILKVMDVDAQNLPLDDFQDAEGMVNFYMKKTDEEIDAIYKEYYGEDDVYPKMKLLIVGEFEFPRDDVAELEGKTLIHRIDVLKFVLASKAVEIGEEMISNGYDSYIVLNDYDLSTIHSPFKAEEEHYWYAWDGVGGVVAFNTRMELVAGFNNIVEMEEEISDLPFVLIENQFCDVPQVFAWKFHDPANPYDAEFRKTLIKKEREQEKYDSKVYKIASDIWDGGTLYQNLYRCNEADKELLEDEKLWQDVMEGIKDFMVHASENFQVDPINRALRADELAETIIEENNVYHVAHRTAGCPVELMFDIELWEMVMEKMMTIIDDMMTMPNSMIKKR